MKKPDNFLSEVWEQIPDDEKKQIYLNYIVTAENAPAYLADVLLDNDELTIDKKIKLAEKVLSGELLNPTEKNILGIAD